MKVVLQWRFWLPVCCGLASALGAGWFIHLYVEARLAERTENGISYSEHVTIVVPARDLAAGSRLSPSELQLRRVPGQGLPADVIPASQADILFEQVLNVAVGRGRPIQQIHLKPQRSEQLSAKLEPGQRAFTLAVNSAETNAGLIRPGDRLDLYRLTARDAVPLILSVPVLAVGSTWTQSGEQYGETNYRTLTLAVSASYIAYLSQLNQRHELAFWLRGDHSETEVVSPAGGQVNIIVAGYAAQGSW